MAFCALFLVACNTTEQAREVEKKVGFLKDYSMLKEGGDNEPLLIYNKEGVDWSQYKKIMIDPIQVWTVSGSELKSLEKKELENLLAVLNGTVKAAFKDDFEVTLSPGPNTLRLKIALTDGESSEPVTDTLSSVIPITLALTYLKDIAVGRHLSVGAASIEAELVDSVTGERLSAGMDTRYGGKGFEGKFESWDDVKSAFEFWSARLNSRLSGKEK